MNEYLALIPLILLAIIFYSLKRKKGFHGELREYIKTFKLKPGKDKEQVSVEFLRQNFLVSHPQYRDTHTTELFLKSCSSVLEYKSKDEDYEDGSFIVNKHSTLLEKEKPITYEDYRKTEFPDGDGWGNDG